MVACTNKLAQDPSFVNLAGVRCAGHTLQLCINTALKQDPVCRTVAAARRVVSHFKKSAKATTALAEKQKEQNVAVHKLVQDVMTRWNSVYLMLDCLLEQRAPVSAVLADSSVSKQSDRNLELTTSQWRTAEDTVNVLKPMITLTELLSQDVNASLSATVPMLMDIKKRHLVVHGDDSKVIKVLKTTLIDEIDRRWELKEPGLETSIYIKAAVLDPRFKKLSFFTDEQRSEAYSAVANLTESLLDRPVREESTDSEMVEEHQPKEKDLVLAMLLSVSSDEEEGQLEEEGSKMKAYIQDCTKSSTGLREWWLKKEERNPKLSRAAKRIHRIPTTSTPSERIFSKSGFIASKARSALLPGNVNKLVFLPHNLKRIQRSQVQ